VPEAHREALATYLKTCTAAAPDFRWTATVNLHLTIRFIGRVDRPVVDSIADRLEALRPRGFELGLGEVGTFKRGPLVRVVWLQVRGDPVAPRTLAGQVEAECVRAGLDPEARPLQPHLTLARARSRAGSILPSLPTPPELPAWRAEDLILYSSILGRGGSVYEAVRSIKLG
jgi:RNA 2',3'-cyclic 3'-phosphodiesterase